MVLSFQGLDADLLWASISNNHLNSIALLLKQCTFGIRGKVCHEALSLMQGQFKDEFVTAGGVPLSEVFIMVSIQSSVKLFSPQNAWSGGYIAGTRIGELASRQPVKGNSATEI
ncbi:hypothetical protein GW17_00027186 [Ensete ventricosum]|nr:hypothetical protein GW17_00027186 [Ensete ventricosum]